MKKGKREKVRGVGFRNPYLAVILSGTLTLTTCLAGPQVKTQAAESTDTQLHNPTVVMNECDTVYFGSYWQEDTNGDGVADQKDDKTPIRWRILSKDGNDAYVIADQVLDAKPYNEENTEVTWETCTLRTWLNEEFYNTAFTAEEQGAVIEQTLVNMDEEIYELFRTESENDTTDKVYLPSTADMRNSDYGFHPGSGFDDQGRIGMATAYAKSHGVDKLNDRGGSSWWLRWSGRTHEYVYSSGYVNSGLDVDKASGGVRPALHLDLSSPLVTTAGKQEISLKSVSWDMVELGSYEGKPIKWRVLEVSDGTAFLLADRILTKKAYHDEKEGITWKDSTLRAWLNGEFYEQSFTDEEKSGILFCTYENADSEWKQTEGEEDTQDRITLLSLSDLVRKEYGFPTDYYCQHNARIACDEKGLGQNGYGSEWWLRSPGFWTGKASYVVQNGTLFTSGYRVDHASGGVRPALRIFLSSSLLITGSVTADITGMRYSGEQEETTTEAVSTAAEKETTAEPALTTTEKKTETPTTAVTVTTEAETPTEAEFTDTQLHNPTVVMNECDTVYFGSYWQEDTNGDGVADQNDDKTPIRWRILSKDGNDAYVIADQVLDINPYNEKYTNVTWETCTLRAWLNEDFYNNAFTEEEQGSIIEQVLVNEDNYFGIAGGNNTTDKVYLPSLTDMREADYGFQKDHGSRSDQARIATPTAYAKSQGANVNDELDSSWWLRSPGDSADDASLVFYNGKDDLNGYSVDYATLGVRPALHLNLSSPLVSKVGKQEISLKSASWDTVEFGNYDGKPITWRVLEVSDGTAYLLAEQILTKKAYHEESENITWKDSTLRAWLNGEFYEESFTDAEKSEILPYTYENAGNGYGIEGGEDTQDRITLLSLSDSIRKEYGFPTCYWCEHSARIACDKNGFDSNGNSKEWWLRSPGGHMNYAAIVHWYGEVFSYGDYVAHATGGVRPALHISLSSSLLKTGRVTADENGMRYRKLQDEATTEAAIAATENETEDPTTTEKETEPVTTEKETESSTTTEKETEPVTTEKETESSTTTEKEAGPVTTEKETEAPMTTEKETEPVTTEKEAVAQTTTEQKTQQAATEHANPQQTTTETGKQQTVTTEAAKTEATTEAAETVTAPAKPSLKTVTNKASKKLTAKWKKVSGAEGYEVSIATKKNFKSGKKEKLTKKTTYTFTKLKKGKTYYVRVRAYRIIDGDKLYGTYSAVKKLKIRK